MHDADERRRALARVKALLPRRPTRPPGESYVHVPGPNDGPVERDVNEVIGDCGVYEHGSRRPGRVPLHEAREVADSTSGFVWIGLQQPTPEQIAKVAYEFHLPPLAVEDAVIAHQRPKLETYDDVLFVVL